MMLFIVNKCLVGRYFETMKVYCFPSKLHQLVLRSIDEL
jgi:hypothetical protein